MESIQREAKRRLMRDFQEVMVNPLPTVRAQPIGDSNLLEWHANLTALQLNNNNNKNKNDDNNNKTNMYNDVNRYGSHHIAHIILKFPSNYPRKPPDVILCTHIRHEHVHNNRICLDMLENWSGFERSGWSSGYTVHSILLQLQSFLFDRVSTCKANVIEALHGMFRYRCRECGHTYEHPVPSVPAFQPLRNLDRQNNIIVDDQDRIVSSLDRKDINDTHYNESDFNIFEINNDKIINQESKELFPSCGQLSDIPDIILDCIFSFLSIRNLYSKIRFISRRFYYLFLDERLNRRSLNSVNQRKEICCYFTRRTFEEDVLGVGIKLEYSVNQKTRQRFLSGVSSPLELLSFTAYKHLHVRQSSRSQEFTFWLPIYINRRHASKAKRLFQQAVMLAYNNSRFSPWDAVDLLCRLMNSTMVSIMKSQDRVESIRALDGYIWFYRLLYYVLDTGTNLQQQIDSRIKRFISSPKFRHKHSIRNLGDFFPLLTVSSYEWPEIAPSLLGETLARSMLWILRGAPYLSFLATPEALEVDAGRRGIGILKKSDVKASFEVCETALRLLMFHVFFLSQIARPSLSSWNSSNDDAEVELNHREYLSRIAEQYDGNLGFASETTQDMLLKGVHKIKKVKSFRTFFKYIYVDENEPLENAREEREVATRILRQSAQIAVQQQYIRPSQK